MTARRVTVLAVRHPAWGHVQILSLVELDDVRPRVDVVVGDCSCGARTVGCDAAEVCDGLADHLSRTPVENRHGERHDHNPTL